MVGLGSLAGLLVLLVFVLFTCASLDGGERGNVGVFPAWGLLGCADAEAVVAGDSDWVEVRCLLGVGAVHGGAEPVEFFIEVGAGCFRPPCSWGAVITGVPLVPAVLQGVFRVEWGVDCAENEGINFGVGQQGLHGGGAVLEGCGEGGDAGCAVCEGVMRVVV